MISRTIQVGIDDRVRLMSAVLAATNWAETEQSHKRYRAHVHARRTAKWVDEHRDHPAVDMLQTLLDQHTPLDALYTYALNLSWPDLTLQTSIPWAPLHWDAHLGDFYTNTGLVEWWDTEQEAWHEAEDQIQKIMDQTNLYRFFVPFIGEIAEQLTLMPNISYPGDRLVGVRLAGELCCVVPPRVAWGDNEPWPFDEDPGYILRGALLEYGRLLMVSYLRHNAAIVAPLSTTILPVDKAFRENHPTWSDQFTELFITGAAAIFLEQVIGPQESEAYVLMENKLHGATLLPGVIGVLKRYLTEYYEGRYTELTDYLPNFAQHLRVAKRMISL